MLVQGLIIMDAAGKVLYPGTWSATVHSRASPSHAPWVRVCCAFLGGLNSNA